MATNDEFVSVVMTTFNHERYISESVESVLNQTHSQLEVVVVNDGSTDRTVKILDGFNDKRLKVINQENQGPSAAFNAGIAAAKGSWIAFFSGDDVCHTDRIAKQLECARKKKVPTVFGLPRLIDSDSRPLDDSAYHHFFGNHPTSPSTAILRRLFWEGNYLCAPTAFVSRDTLLAAGPLHTGSLQLQDYELWLRLGRQGEMFRMDDRVIAYRVHEGSLSYPGPNTDTRRLEFEKSAVIRRSLEGWTAKQLRCVFPGETTPGIEIREDSVELEIEKSFLFLMHRDRYVQRIGAERLFEQMSVPEFRDQLATTRDFGFRELTWLTGQFS